MVRKERTLKVPVTRVQLAHFKAAAADAGLSLAEWLRRCALRTIRSGERLTDFDVAG